MPDTPYVSDDKNDRNNNNLHYFTLKNGFFSTEILSLREQWMAISIFILHPINPKPPLNYLKRLTYTRLTTSS